MRGLCLALLVGVFAAAEASTAQGGSGEPRVSIDVPVDEQIADWRGCHPETCTALPLEEWSRALRGPMQRAAEVRLFVGGGDLAAGPRCSEALSYLEALRVVGLYQQSESFEARFRERWGVEADTRVVWDLLRVAVLRRMGRLAAAGAVLTRLGERIGADRGRRWIEYRIRLAGWAVDLCSGSQAPTAGTNRKRLSFRW